MKSMPVTGNQVEFSWVRATPSTTAPANPGARIVTLGTVASKDNTLDRTLVNEETDDPFLREL